MGSARAGQALERITASAATVSQMTLQIASASEQQAATADEINRSITRIHEAASAGTRTLQRTGDACAGLKQVSRQLQEQVAKVVI